MSAAFDFIQSFVAEILHEVGVEPDQSDTYSRLERLLADRINARLLLDLVASVTPEQAVLIKRDLESAEPNPERLINSLAQQVPGLQAQVAQTLANIRSELIEDFTAVVKSAAKS